MLFNSLQFAFFFFIIVTLYFTVPHRFRWLLLLIGSYFFYMCWNWKYIGLIIISTLIDYYAGMRMAAMPDKKRRQKYLILSLVANLGLLFIFKYFNFFSASANSVFSFVGLSLHIPYLHVLLPVGISFYTFQTLSYSIDVYRGKIEHERHLGKFALYVSFFPQLVAGPIERASRLLPQFNRINHFNAERAASGLRLMLWGLFKKIVVANRLALYVNAVYGNAEMHNGLTLLIATWMFSIQVYCDFSGYSDIAIGAARVLGYDLMKNFNRPFFAKTINEFWARWHISLTTWFRDYLYYPLGGNRKGVPRQIVNLFIVFVLSGMWHGAAWTFFFWAILHWSWAVASRFTLPARDRLLQRLKVPGNFIAAVRMFNTFQLFSIANIFFRAGSLGKASFIVSQIFSFSWGKLFVPQLDQFTYALVAIFAVFMVEVALEKYSLLQKFVARPRSIRWAAYLGVMLIMLIMGVFDESQFIYFQF